ncbi:MULTISPECIES: hypothetical protein [Rhizobium]|uniref:hypothetical protein n=1 Tax=Rhizobium TaxID=379 RepID=UPI0007E99912|nr:MULTISPECIES: hypothetical protein [Rhizobium]ANK90630.1 hypothetical protein AMK01_CH01122 [Rhizobium sp. N6212]ANK96659.1 hypothetical protein AMK00_CH01124 [Rhizobium sp. N621]ANL02779.1 hypothetical protein AMJ99_CH01192 [Rhizobium esperanzae]ANL08828.1 hypothetical protein AMJ98_CH01113 [Rhizobium sp. N1341]ANL20875.1 hypothetical protein AMJ96_CH01116 [Rhizobium sp. N113]
MEAVSRLSTWGAENIQASLFMNAPHKVTPAELFQMAFGAEAETTNEASHPQFGKLGIASTAKDGRTRSVQAQPGRVDVVFHPSGLEIASGGFPELQNDIDDAVESVREAASKIADSLILINRAAINVRLAKHSNDMDEADNELIKVLPAKGLNIKGVRDFLLQMNSRITDGGFELNRLVKWSTEIVQVYADAAFGQFTPGGPSQMLLREFWAAAVQFDFNTVVPGPILSPKEARDGLAIIAKTLVAARRQEIF